MSAAAWESVALEIGAAEPIPELRGRQGPWTEEQYLVLGERRRWRERNCSTDSCS